MSEEDKLREHCLVEVCARQRWAEAVSDDWFSKASQESILMVNKSLETPIDVQAEQLFQYWKFRSQATSDNRIIDQFAKDQWNAVLAGNPIDGNYSHFQKKYPEPSSSAPGM